MCKPIPSILHYSPPKIRIIFIPESFIPSKFRASLGNSYISHSCQYINVGVYNKLILHNLLIHNYLDLEVFIHCLFLCTSYLVALCNLLGNSCLSLIKVFYKRRNLLDSSCNGIEGIYRLTLVINCTKVNLS